MQAAEARQARFGKNPQVMGEGRQVRMPGRIGGIERDDNGVTVRGWLAGIEHIEARAREGEIPGHLAVGGDPVGHDVDHQGKGAGAGLIGKPCETFRRVTMSQGGMETLHVARVEDAAATGGFERGRHEDGIETQFGGVVEHAVPGIERSQLEWVHIVDSRWSATRFLRCVRL